MVSSSSSCALTMVVIDELYLFTNIITGSIPIATTSLRFSFPYITFIQEEITHLMKEDVIQYYNTSTWRAQIAVVKNPALLCKKRLCID